MTEFLYTTALAETMHGSNEDGRGTDDTQKKSSNLGAEGE